jgi:hypothetical protein
VDKYRAARFWLVLTMLGALGVVIAGVSRLFPGGGAVSVLVIVVATLVLAGCAALHVLLAAYVPTRRKLTRASGGTVDLASIRQENATFTENFDPDQITLYVKSVLNLREFRARVVEEITPLRRVLRQKLSITVTAPATDPAEQLLLPVLLPLKGELEDDLLITVDDNPATTLTHREYLLLTTAAIESLLIPAVGSLNPEQTAILRGATDTALRLVAHRGQLTKADQPKVDECANTLIALAPQAGDSLIVAAVLVRKLANNYAVVAMIPAGKKNADKRLGDKCVVTCERNLIPSLQLASARNPLRYLRDRLGALLGARPIYLSLSVSNAATADSYHLLVTGPDGLYVGWQNMADPGGLFTQPSVDQNLSEPYARFQRRRGQRYLHLYTRSIPDAMAEKLVLDVRFFEVPPGSMAAATLAAASSFALIYLVSLILPGTFNASSPSALGSDFPALVLAFPAVAGALVGVDRRPTSLVGGTLSSKASSFLTVILSLCASGLFMAQEAGDLRLRAAFAVLGVKDVWWQILTVVGLFNTVYAFYTWLTQTARFYWLADRPDDRPPGGPTEH